MAKTLIDTFDVIHVTAHFGGAFVKARLVLVEDVRVGGDGRRHLLPLDVLQIADRHVEDIGFFQFGVS